MAEGGGEEQATGARSGTHKVFISYASPNSAVAEAACEALERTGVTCWIAPRDVTPGASYAGQIIHAIDASKAIVLILSENAASSPHVLREVERAASKRHPIISLRLDQAPLPADFEYFLNTSHWLDASAGDIARVMPKLSAAVQIAIETQAATPAGSSTSHAPTPSTSARSRKRTAIAVALFGLVIAGLAADRLWLFNRRSAATAPTVPTPAPAPAATIPEKSVAVLPFVDMSKDKDQEYFSDGLSEELIDMLTKIPDLRVPARTSSFYFKGKPTKISEIAKELGVMHVLEGSVRKSGDALRITAQLVRADNGYHLWSETYERKLDDIFKIQDEIAAAVVQTLKVSLIEGSMPKTARTANTEAYNLYLRAQSIFLRENTKTDDETVVDYLRKVLDADPKFVDAWEELSEALSVEGENGFVPMDSARKEAGLAAQHALELGPGLADPHVAMARILIVDDLDLTGGEDQLRQALELEPNNAWALSLAGMLAGWRGDFDKAIKIMQSSVAGDPVNSSRYRDLANILFFARKYPGAMDTYRKRLDMNPGDREKHQFIGRVLLAKGDSLGALAEMDRETDDQRRLSNSYRVLAYDALGRKAEADAALTYLEQKDDDPYGIGRAYANRGDRDQAFKWFDRAYRQRDSSLLAAKVDPLLKNVQSDSRFTVVLKRLGLAH